MNGIERAALATLHVGDRIECLRGIYLWCQVGQLATIVDFKENLIKLEWDCPTGWSLEGRGPLTDWFGIWWFVSGPDIHLRKIVRENDWANDIELV